jgi:3-hydroxybutyryl-CoA dehydrogenase
MERLGIAGAGAIACGLAAAAAQRGQVLLWARSDRSADRARQSVEKICSKLTEAPGVSEQVQVVREIDALADSTFLVEAVVEDQQHKASLLAVLADHAAEDAVLSTTTSSLSIEDLARASGRPDRFVGLHPFNPVQRMKLVELVFPQEAAEHTRARARTLCQELDKTAVEVPDIPGFVVNRLLFPYLFSAVGLMTQTGVAPEHIDTCMTLGAGQPMGPIALLDFVGLDVAEAIGDAIGADVPPRLRELVREGMLGRKTGRGFFVYE